MKVAMLIVVDDGLGHLKPLVDFRAVFDQRTAAHTTLQRIERLYDRQADALFVPAKLAELAQMHHPDAAINQINAKDTTRPALIINGRCLVAGIEEVLIDLKPATALIQSDGQVVAIHSPGGEHDQTLKSLNQNTSLEEIAARFGHQAVQPNTLITRPWHILSRLPETIKYDLAHTRLPVSSRDDCQNGSCVSPPQIALVCPQAKDSKHHLHIADSVRLSPNIVINIEHGSVVIDEDATIQPGAVIEGPCYIGRSSTIAAHAHLRSNTAIGPCCKVGGEVSHGIIQGYSNKAHAGYLGHSLVGAWCNLGANTNVSNLKNSYGNIRVRLDPDKTETENTGLDKLGPTFGDFVRTGIGTHVLTGQIIPSGVMIAGLPFAPKRSQPFGFYTPDSKIDLHEIEPLLTTLRRMMAKHHLELPVAMEKKIRQMMDEAKFGRG